jgi:hypothetical protein
MKYAPIKNNSSGQSKKVRKRKAHKGGDAENK